MQLTDLPNETFLVFWNFTSFFSLSSAWCFSYTNEIIRPCCFFFFYFLNISIPLLLFVANAANDLFFAASSYKMSAVRYPAPCQTSEITCTDSGSEVFLDYLVNISPHLPEMLYRFPGKDIDLYGRVLSNRVIEGVFHSDAWNTLYLFFFLPLISW